MIKNFDEYINESINVRSLASKIKKNKTNNGSFDYVNYVGLQEYIGPDEFLPISCFEIGDLPENEDGSHREIEIHYSKSVNKIYWGDAELSSGATFAFDFDKETWVTKNIDYENGGMFFDATEENIKKINMTNLLKIKDI